MPPGSGTEPERFPCLFIAHLLLLNELTGPGAPYRRVQTRMAPLERVCVFPTRTPMRDCCPFKPAQKQFIKCQFYIGFEPLWAWVCYVLDRQDEINELFYYVLRAIGAETAACCLPVQPSQG